MEKETERSDEKQSYRGRLGMRHAAKRGHHDHCGCHAGGSVHRGSALGLFGQRRFLTKEEELAHLEEYLKKLQAEATGVEEHIAELKKENA